MLISKHYFIKIYYHYHLTPMLSPDPYAPYALYAILCMCYITLKNP